MTTTSSSSPAAPAPSARAMAATAATIMVNGLPGVMAVGCAEVALERGFRLCPVALAGSRSEVITVSGCEVQLYPKAAHEEAVEKAISACGGASGSSLLVIDYTTPAAVSDNIALYARYGLPFVCGTTGYSGKPEDLAEIVEKGKDGECYAVIAPNMNKQIVAFQAMVGYAAETFPGVFANYNLSIKESHQKTKKDTSGTAKALCNHMSSLASDASFTVDKIQQVRDDKSAMDEMGVPEAALTGHAFHTYTFQKQGASPDLSGNAPECFFQFKHNICGRRSYCEGTVDAVEWLCKKMAEKPEKKVYNMIDVLKG